MIVGEHTEEYAARPDDGRKPLTVKEMAADMQPREKARRFGIESLATSELLALVLRTGLPGYPVTDVCRDLMRSCGDSLHTLELRPYDDLLRQQGIGPTKAIQIEAVMEIVRRYMRESAPDDVRIRTSADVYGLMRPRIGNLDHEEIWVVLLNRANRVVKVQPLSKGGRSASVFDVKMVMKEALLQNASGMVLCHNHPSGALTPSGPDDQITRRLAEACRSMDMLLLDHIIISDSGHYSYADNGRL